jgi:hypothetical protein
MQFRTPIGSEEDRDHNSQVMPVRDEFRLYLLDQMREAHGGVTSRRMFGGLGLYADGLFFGVVTTTSST